MTDVLLEVIRRGPVARAEIARRLDLSPATLTRITRPLVESGLLRETGESLGVGPGRPARPIEVVADRHHFIGVKVSHREVSAVLTDLGATILDGEASPLRDLAPEAVVASIAALLRRFQGASSRVAAVGVSLGGTVEDRRRVRHSPFLGWDDVPLAVMLERTLGAPVSLDNDVLALTRAEQWFGAGRRIDHFAVLTLGAGTGYGLVVHDRVVEGCDAGIGLLGHFPVGVPGPVCELGHQGCAVGLTDTSITQAVSDRLGRPVDYRTALDLASAGDPVVGPVVAAAGRALGHLVAAVANVAATPHIVLAGEGAALAEVAREQVRHEVDAWRDPRATPVDLEVRETGSRQWARGAAVTAMQEWLGQLLP